PWFLNRNSSGIHLIYSTSRTTTKFRITHRSRENSIIGNSASSASQFDAGLFVGDDWRVRPNLTLSLGLRYETQTNIALLKPSRLVIECYGCVFSCQSVAIITSLALITA